MVKEHGIENMIPIKFREDYYKAYSMGKIEEIRLRINRPIMFYNQNGEVSIEKANSQVVMAEDLRETMEYISGYSLYAFENEIREGFITIKGGHRIGLAGKIVLENGKIKNITNISSINIRISHEIEGIAQKVSKNIYENELHNLLIISPPAIGKTTILRDIVRIGSDIHKRKITVIDERSEIAATYMGAPANNIGVRSDVLDGCPKDKGIMMALRALSPEIIAVDEIGTDEDVEAVKEAFNCGIYIFATVHGRNVDELKRKKAFKEIIENKYFDRYLVLNKDINGNRIMKLYDRDYKEIQW